MRELKLPSPKIFPKGQCKFVQKNWRRLANRKQHKILYLYYLQGRPNTSIWAFWLIVVNIFFIINSKQLLLNEFRQKKLWNTKIVPLRLDPLGFDNALLNNINHTGEDIFYNLSQINPVFYAVEEVETSLKNLRTKL